MVHKTPIAIVQSVLSDYDAGMPIIRISMIHGLSETAIKSLVHKTGRPSRIPGKVTGKTYPNSQKARKAYLNAKPPNSPS